MNTQYTIAQQPAPSPVDANILPQFISPIVTGLAVGLVVSYFSSRQTKKILLEVGRQNHTLTEASKQSTTVKEEKAETTKTLKQQEETIMLKEIKEMLNNQSEKFDTKLDEQSEKFNTKLDEQSKALGGKIDAVQESVTDLKTDVASLNHNLFFLVETLNYDREKPIRLYDKSKKS